MFFWRTRTSGLALIVPLLVVIVCITPWNAAAATAPTVTEPNAGAEASTGSALTVTWTGALQGDTGTTDRSTFRVELGSPSTVPSDVATVWEDASVYAITTPGEAATSLTLGVPETPATYSLRVCAWGVDPLATDDIVSQLACTSPQALVVNAASTSSGTTETVTVDETRTVKAPDTVVTRPAPTTEDTTTETAPDKPAEVVEEAAPVQVTNQIKETVENITEPIADIAEVDTGPATDKELGISSVGTGLVSSLGWKLPGIGIPFWTLLLLAVPIVFSLWFRKAAFGMFDLEGDVEDDDLDEIPDDDLSDESSSLPVISDTIDQEAA